MKEALPPFFPFFSRLGRDTVPCRAESPLLTSYVTLGELLSLSEPMELLLSAEFSTLLVPHYSEKLSVFSPRASVSSPVK